MAFNPRPCRDAAEQLGITDVEFIHRSKHVLMIGRIGNKTIREFIASSASDHRAIKNVVARLRRIVFEATGTKPWLQ
jgi:hypothetical protein